MISLLTGNQISIKDGVALLDVNGVGYDIFVNEPDHVGVVPRVSYYTHCHCPQDSAMQLFGFRTMDERKLFRRLIELDGVGPKVGMRIVGAHAINANGVPVPATLKAIRGVGPKIVERIIEAFNAVSPIRDHSAKCEQIRKANFTSVCYCGNGSP